MNNNGISSYGSYDHQSMMNRADTTASFVSRPHNQLFNMQPDNGQRPGPHVVDPVDTHTMSLVFDQQQAPFAMPLYQYDSQLRSRQMFFPHPQAQPPPPQPQQQQQQQQQQQNEPNFYVNGVAAAAAAAAACAPPIITDEYSTRGQGQYQGSNGGGSNSGGNGGGRQDMEEVSVGACERAYVWGDDDNALGRESSHDDCGAFPVRVVIVRT